MMKRTKLLTLLTLPLLLAGCVDSVPTKGEVVVDIKSFLSEEPKSYHITFEYDDAYFSDAYTYSHDLQMLSYGASMSTKTLPEVYNFYLALGFDNIYASLPTPTEDTVGYAIAHKAMADANLVAVSIRGLDYGMEWLNNFTIGESGNHEGFDARANEIYTILCSYIHQYRAKPVKLWLTGYSRAGGIANVLASKVMENSSKLKVEQKNVFVYTFEAPNGLSVEHAEPYANVYNIVNAADLVAMIPPPQYGLYRCGQDIVYKDFSDVDAKLAELDPNLSLPPFDSEFMSEVTSEVEMAEYVINFLLQDTYDETTTLATREGFARNYQEHIKFFMGLYYGAPEGTIQLLLERFQQMEVFEILSLLGTTDGVYSFVKPILDEKGASYDDDILRAACAALQNLVIAKIGLIAGIFMSEEFKNNLMRCVDMHAMEVVYILIK